MCSLRDVAHLSLWQASSATKTVISQQLGMQDFHTRVEGSVSGEDLAQLLFKVFQQGREQEDAEGADRAAQSAVRKLEIKVSLYSITSKCQHLLCKLDILIIWCCPLRFCSRVRSQSS